MQGYKEPHMLLQYKVAIATGGGLNIGHTISHDPARNGARVIIADIVEDASRGTPNELVSVCGEGHSFFLTDMTDESCIAALRDFVLDKDGQVDLPSTISTSPARTATLKISPASTGGCATRLTWTAYSRPTSTWSPR